MQTISMHNSPHNSKKNLLDLPEELIIKIAWAIEPEDFDVWLSTCHTIYEVSKECIDGHRKLKAKYSRIVLTEHPATLLHQIWKDPVVARYITSLGYHEHDALEVGTDDLAIQQLDECNDDLLTKTPYFMEVLKNHASIHDKRGVLRYESDAFTLLLCLLPNVTKLTLNHPRVLCDTMAPVVQAIAKDLLKLPQTGLT